MPKEILFAVITLSDKAYAGQREDTSGPIISKGVENLGKVIHYEILPDDKEAIKSKLRDLTDKVNVIITTGGTGLSPRDVTPEATLEVIDREIPGIAEAMRRTGLQKTNRAMLSRAVAGQRGKTLIVNLPGSSKAVKENLEAIVDVIPHAVEKIMGDPGDCARL